MGHGGEASWKEKEHSSKKREEEGKRGCVGGADKEENIKYVCMSMTDIYIFICMCMEGGEGREWGMVRCLECQALQAGLCQQGMNWFYIYLLFFE